MKTGSIIIISVLLVFAAAAALFSTTRKQPTNTSNTQTNVTQGGSIPLDQPTISNTNDELKLVDGASDAQASSLPTPDQFGQYDQYKDDASMRYIDTAVGTGAQAVAGKKVAVAYKGWLTDGTMFDQSKTGQSFVFTLGNHEVISGWDQGINGMNVGSKRRLLIPSALGYGPNGQGPIPGGALLVFDVELEAVEE